MRPDDPPPAVLQLPAKGWRPTLRLRPRGDGCELTDWSRGRVFVAAALNALFVLLSVPVLAALGFALWQSTQPPKPATTRPDLAALLLGAAIILVVQTGIWIALRVVTRSARRFTVRIDPERRECVARSTILGWTRRRATFELRGATADVTAAAYRPPPAAGGGGGRGLLVVLTLLGGPLGWFIYFLTLARGRGKGNRQLPVPPAVDAVTLVLFDGQGHPRVAVTSGDETATASFLVAWDTATGR